jgi:lantibiotic modifying enzyme
VTASENSPPGPPEDRDSLYEGIGGLALALGEIKLAREWTEDERTLADGIVSRLSVAYAGGECGLYVGLAGSLVAVAVLAPTASTGLLGRLANFATPTGWPSSIFDDPASPINDLIMGNAGIVLACAWLGGERADRLAALGADALVASAISAPHGLAWKMYQGDRDRVMPNYSHGTAGIAAALAVAGHRLLRPDLVEAARLGAEHLVAVADLDDAGFRLPLQVPPADDSEPYAYGWCHGPTGTAHLFGALALAGVTSVAGRSCAEWMDRAARSIQASGLPARLRPGFWDNDGRCCGTAGVLDATLNRAQATGDATHLAFADRLAAALVGRAVRSPAENDLRYWRFHEHRIDPPELDPGVGWMQGAAGIVSALDRYARIREQGLTTPRLFLPDDWWMGIGEHRLEAGR